jgi:transposase
MISSSSVKWPVINGLSNHDAKLIKLENVFMQKKANEVKTVRKSDFKIKLNEETWDNTFDESDVNTMFDNFHNTYLRIFIPVFLKNNSSEEKREYLDD